MSRGEMRSCASIRVHVIVMALDIYIARGAPLDPAFFHQGSSVADQQRAQAPLAVEERTGHGAAPWSK
jgi:hypothetical protein